ncbi:MAG TPA: hypothetical protein VGS16_00665 [Candidatus Dormibacteraeota bacterium]|nr:hypothetical protein [Candidatus Dormibacteraeota bacterium]
MHTIGGDHWSWSLIGSRSIEFCVWTLIQDGLHVHPFDMHTNGNGELRRAGLDAARWTGWFEKVVHAEVEGQEKFRFAHGHESAFFYESDPPTIAEQLEMQQSLQAKTPPGLWRASKQVGELLGSLWADYSYKPVLRRRRQFDPLHAELPGTASQHSQLYDSMHEIGSSLPSVYCFPVAYPNLVVREVAPVALILTSPKQWTWEQYRDALLAGVAKLTEAPKS